MLCQLKKEVTKCYAPGAAAGAGAGEGVDAVHMGAAEELRRGQGEA